MTMGVFFKRLQFKYREFDFKHGVFEAIVPLVSTVLLGVWVIGWLVSYASANNIEDAVSECPSLRSTIAASAKPIRRGELHGMTVACKSLETQIKAATSLKSGN